MTVAAYPFGRLPKLTRAERALSRHAARSLPLARLDAVRTALAPLLGAMPALRPLPLETCPPRALRECVAEPLVAVVLRGRARGPFAALELEPRLADCVVDRALGGTAGGAIGQRAVALDATSRGVLAHVVGRVMATLGEGAPRVAEVVTTSGGLASAIGDDGAAVWPGILRIGDDEGIVRLWIPAAWLPLAPSPRAGGPALTGLRVELCAEIGGAKLDPSDMRTLAPGDVLVLDIATARRHPTGVRGTALLRVAGTATRHRTSFHCALADGTLRVTDIDRSEEPPMTQGERRADAEEDAVALVGDAPIEVRVEIARVALPLEEIAALRPGEVVTTGRAIGETVTLRAGDRAIATGELVDVDGEVGVRILKLA